jgi:hypothetical protein
MRGGQRIWDGGGGRLCAGGGRKGYPQGGGEGCSAVKPGGGGMHTVQTIYIARRQLSAVLRQAAKSL